MRNLVFYARQVVGHATRLLDTAFDVNARLVLLLQEEKEQERERLDEEQKKSELTKLVRDDVDMDEDGKASLSDNQNNQNRPAGSATTERRQDETISSKSQLDERVRDSLMQGVVFRVLRPLATALCLFLDDTLAASAQLHQRLASSLLPLLVPLLKSLGTCVGACGCLAKFVRLSRSLTGSCELYPPDGPGADAINARADEVSSMELGYHERENAKLLFKTVDRKKVETPHNYYPNTDEEKIVRIPGATHLCVTFDERCNLVRCGSPCAVVERGLIAIALVFMWSRSSALVGKG
jgi:hypothetical protein